MSTGYEITIQKQYANSPALAGLLASFDQWCDLSKFTDSFLTDVWDISTAQGFGLDIWGRILGQSRYLNVQQVPGDNFGFDIGAVAGTNWKPFNVAPFYNGQDSGNVAFALSDTSYRQLLWVKAAANIASCNVPALNTLLRSMFKNRGQCYVGYDPLAPMHVGYHFDFMPTAVERSIIESGLFPQPAGTTVRYIYRELTYTPFGFAGANTGANTRFVAGFDQAPFYNPLVS